MDLGLNRDKCSLSARHSSSVGAVFTEEWKYDLSRITDISGPGDITCFVPLALRRPTKERD